jgi:hypothetical protein
MFRADFLLIIRRIDSVQTAAGIVMCCVDWLLPNSNKLAVGQQPVNTVDLPVDEQQACSKHLEAYY